MIVNQDAVRTPAKSNVTPAPGRESGTNRDTSAEAEEATYKGMWP
jgi:hypothetical protein